MLTSSDLSPASRLLSRKPNVAAAGGAGWGGVAGGAGQVEGLLVFV